MIPKYIVFNTNMPDKNGNALPVGQGNDLDALHLVIDIINELKDTYEPTINEV